ncbi:MAG: flagellar export protein FliJ [Gammaproteobacteria bacterium]|nr:MAG: flagellar export protein FliJ [Gammaproteobacteria bacterium]
MKRSQRMLPVRKLKEQEERTFARKFAQAQQQVEQEKQQLSMLENYQRDYFANISSQQTQHTGVSLSATQLDKYQLFLGRLHTAIENQQQVLVIKEAALKVAREQWAAANARLKALDSLIANIKAEEAQMQDKQEQRLIDDLPLRSNRYD